jgi:hypothetical protein
MVKLQFTGTSHDKFTVYVCTLSLTSHSNRSVSKKKKGQTSTARHLPYAIETVRPTLACSAIYEGFTAHYSGETR